MRRITLRGSTLLGAVLAMNSIACSPMKNKTKSEFIATTSVFSGSLDLSNHTDTTTQDSVLTVQGSDGGAQAAHQSQSAPSPVATINQTSSNPAQVAASNTVTSNTVTSNTVTSNTVTSTTDASTGSASTSISANDGGGATSSDTPSNSTQSTNDEQPISIDGNDGGSSPVQMPLVQSTNPVLPVVLPVSYWCSDDGTRAQGTNIKRSQELTVVLKDKATGQVACSLTAGVKENLISNKSINLSSCVLTADSYIIDLIDDSMSTKPSLLTGVFFASGAQAANMVQNIQNIQAAFTGPNPNLQTVNALQTSGFEIDKNHYLNKIKSGPRTGQYALEGSTFLGVLYAANAEDDRCEMNASPLVIDFTAPGEKNLGLQMGAPEDGVLFDILGLRSFPFAHAKKQISWPRNPRYMFLGILSSHGQIEGINQLFGDNTYGPDRRFATDGFAALAKYDENKDGFIDAKDSIFHYLVVWFDSNSNAISDRKEMRRLADMGVTSIDTMYDAEFYERDQYGNESRFKSVVKMKDGSNRLIFDLWFALN
ncbi:MAG: hypothetical protein AB7O96_05405 [Pseudobdellovibrionaceae bacterium]